MDNGTKNNFVLPNYPFKSLNKNFRETSKVNVSRKFFAAIPLFLDNKFFGSLKIASNWGFPQTKANGIPREHGQRLSWPNNPGISAFDAQRNETARSAGGIGLGGLNCWCDLGMRAACDRGVYIRRGPLQSAMVFRGLALA